MPDPYFYLHANRPDLRLRETPNSQPEEPIDPDVYELILNDTEYVVANFFFNSYLSQYINTNKESVEYTSPATKQGSIIVIKLKPKEQRVPIPVESSKVWEYPKL